MITYEEILLIFCILIMCVLLLGIYITQNTVTKSSNGFAVVIIAAAAMLLFNLASEFLEGHPELTPVAFIVNLLTFLGVDGLIIAFAEYLRILLEPYENKDTRGLKVIVAMTLIRVLCAIGLAAAGKLFTIENGCYVEGSLVFIPYVVSCGIMIVLLYVIIINRKCLSKRDFVVMIMYELLPVAPIIIEMTTETYVLTNLAITLSILLVYVLVQAVMIEQSKFREKVLEEISSKDFLTDLRNRRSLYNDLSLFEKKEDIGVLFCDINGLKYTNDNFGHIAGDDLIKRFADILIGFWGKACVYRISGDEFIVLDKNTNMYDFTDKIERFSLVLDQNDEIASFGNAYGTTSRIEKLLKEAEDNMYHSKRRHYEKTGTVTETKTGSAEDN